MQWNWQLSDWPNFSYDESKIKPLEEEFLKKSGELIGALKYIDSKEQENLRIELLSEEALKTSKIEGEILDRESLQSSIKKHFGLIIDQKKIPPAEQGIAMMSVDLYKSFSNLLSHKKLCSWHEMLMNGRVDVQDIGRYRTDKDPMQIVSGPPYKRLVHYEAPPFNVMQSEISTFILWFNETKMLLPALTRSAIAHWYFICIHPFEDGNGRIARALSECALAQSLNQPSLIALAYTIEKNKKNYYSQLGHHNRSNNITRWIHYFASLVLEAQKNTQKRIEFLIAKSKMMSHLKGQINLRQEKVLLRMFNEGIDGFKGGLSAKNYITISDATTATASRDLRDLVNKGALKKTGILKHTRYYLNVYSFK